MNRAACAVLLTALALSSSVVAQTLVKDINTRYTGGGWSSAPEDYVSDGTGWTYFAATSGTVGREVYRTDGVTVELVVDLLPGSTGSNPERLFWTGSRLVIWSNYGLLAAVGMYGYDPVTGTTEYLGRLNTLWDHFQMGGHLYIVGDVGDGLGIELHRTDGTAAGTTLVKDLVPGSLGGGRSSASLVASNGSIALFTATDGVHGSEIWRTDGSTAGTYMIHDVRIGSLSSYPKFVGELAGSWLFTADDGVHGEELWVTDGTSAGTVLLRDIRAGGDDSQPKQGVEFAGRWFFLADDAVHGEEWWVTDGTPAGTALFLDLRPGPDDSYVWQPAVHAGHLYFWADNDDGGGDLWVTDGTAAGTSELLAAPDAAWHGEFSPLASEVMFTISRASGVHELWSSDGTVGGTRKVADLTSTSGQQPYIKPHSSPGGVLVAFEWERWYLNEWGEWRREWTRKLWVSDGTTAGTQLVGDFQALEMYWYVAIPGTTELLFSANDGSTGSEPWISDGSLSGTHILANINGSALNTTEDSLPGQLLDSYGRLFFAAEDWSRGRELWISDGTEAGTERVLDIAPGLASSAPTGLALFRDRVLMSADDGVHGPEPWISDGTAAGTYMLGDVVSGSTGSAPQGFTELGSKALFWVDDAVLGRELWITDGRASGTALVRSFPVSSTPFDPSELMRVGDRVLFAAFDPSSGVELWSSDGTAAGTSLLKDIHPGAGSSLPGEFALWDGKLYFAASDGAQGAELWVSDGTPVGTTLLLDVHPGGNGSSPRSLTPALGHLVFIADDGVHGSEPWISDGTAAGSLLLRDVDPAYDSLIHSFTEVGDKLFFAGRTTLMGHELWVSDGTTAGTVVVKDIVSGFGDTQLSELTAVGDRYLYFAAEGSLYGRQLWRSDGTATGTTLVADLGFGFSSPLAEDMVLSGGQLLFAATPVGAGRELCRLDPGANSKEVGRGSGLSEPRLSTSEAVLGGTWELSVASEIPSSFGYLALSPPARPTSLFMPNYLAQDNQIYLDLVAALSSPLIWVSTDANGDWSLSVPVPAGMSPSPALCVQGVLVNGGKWDLTNAVHFTIGH